MENIIIVSSSIKNKMYKSATQQSLIKDLLPGSKKTA